MSKSKKIIIISAVVAIILIFISIYLYKDYNYTFRVNEDFKYNNEDILLYSNNNSESRTIISNILNDNDDGASIYALNNAGNTSKLLDIYDGIINEAYVENDHLYITYYERGEMQKEYEDPKIKLVDLNLLDVSDYSVTEYNWWEVVVYPREKRILNRNDIVTGDSLRSNIVFYENDMLYMDGK